MLDPGQPIGNYRIVQKLGEGGMGAVFEAVHQDIGRHVAIKVLHPQFSQDQQVAIRFLNEARAAAIVDHPGIVDVFEYGRLPDGTTFLVMEFLKGKSLRALLKQEGKFSVYHALRVTRQIASALAAAHDKGIIHRDLKPDNVVISPDREQPGKDRAKVLDFGIAKVAEALQKQESDHVKTQTGMMLGTPLYMSPEQCRGADGVTGKGDVYSLGVMLFQMLSGSLPFTGQSMGELIALHLFEAPPDLAKLEPTLPTELSALVMRMLAKQADARPTMLEVVKELEVLGADRTDLSAERRPEPGSLLGSAATAAAAPADPNVATNLVSGTGPTFNDKPVQTTAPPSTLGGAVGEVRAITHNRSAAVEVAQTPAPTPAPLEPRVAAPPQSRTLLAVGGLALAGGIALTALLTQRTPAPSPQTGKEVAAPVQVQWLIGSDPKGAQVIRKGDGKVLGTTPFTLTPESPAGELVLILRREGFFDKELKLDAAAGGSRTEILAPITDNQVKILE